jgi:chromosome transmission fidelity protein 4
VLKSLLTAQQQDLIDFTKSSHSQRTALARMEVEIDKTLLQMMAVECREGEERGMRALEMVTLLRDRSGRMIEAAGKVAERYGRNVLVEKIKEVGETQLLGAMEED